MQSSEFKKAYEFSIKGTVSKLTLVMSVLSMVRFVVDVYRLPLSVLLANILKTYQVVFHTCIDVLLIWLPYKVPSWGKDLLIFYSLFAFVYLRVLVRKIAFDYNHPWIIQHNFKDSKAFFVLMNGLQMAKAVVLWPFKIRTLFLTPYLVVGLGGHGPSALYFTKDRPDEAVWRGIYFGDARLMMLLRLSVILLAALVVMLLNYAFSI